jgi:hypothetical protein
MNYIAIDSRTALREMINEVLENIKKNYLSSDLKKYRITINHKTAKMVFESRK